MTSLQIHLPYGGVLEGFPLQLFLRSALHWEVLTYLGLRLLPWPYCRVGARINLINMADDLRSFQVHECLSNLFPVRTRPCASHFALSYPHSA
jgi:hypothetical protein